MTLFINVKDYIISPKRKKSAMIYFIYNLNGFPRGGGSGIEGANLCIPQASAEVCMPIPAAIHPISSDYNP